MTAVIGAGRVGGLAFALGVGAAILALPAIASADSGEAAAPDSSLRSVVSGVHGSTQPTGGKAVRVASSARAVAAARSASGHRPEAPPAFVTSTVANVPLAPIITQAPLPKASRQVGPVAGQPAAAVIGAPLTAAALQTPQQVSLSQVMQYTFLNKPPAASPVQAPGQSAAGVITGHLNASGLPGAILTYNVTQNPSHGSVAVAADGTYTYTPTNVFADAGGADQFTVTVDGSSAFRLTGVAGVLQGLLHTVAQWIGMSGADSTEVVVGVSVLARNRSPIAVADAFDTVEDVSVVGNVLTNDSDPEGNSLTAALVGGPSHGTVVLAPSGSFTYTPAAGFYGTDSFTYIADDGEAVSAVAAVTLTVTEVPPVPGVPIHVALAQQMVSEIFPANNSYTNGKPTVRFAGIDGATTMYNASDCSSFVTQLLQASYDISDATFTSWTGEADPEAEDYYAAAIENRGFIAYNNVHSIETGDLFIIKYTGAQKDTGHMVVVTAAPTYVGVSERTGVEGYQVYSLPILDVTGTPHGSSDSRYATGQDGIGTGYMRLYTDSAGNLITYQWNDYPNGVIYSTGDRLPTFAKVAAIQPPPL